jgi:hypothetical protein
MDCDILELAVRRATQGSVRLTTFTMTYVTRNVEDLIHLRRQWWNITQDGQSPISGNARLSAEKAVVTRCKCFTHRS